MTSCTACELMTDLGQNGLSGACYLNVCFVVEGFGFVGGYQASDFDH